MEFTHFNENGRAKMVSVEEKADTLRVATASAWIFMEPETLNCIREDSIRKGDVLSVAQIAGIMGAKQTSSLIPMCHNLFISGADIEFEIDVEKSAIRIWATVKTVGKTGIEMEALTAVSVAALTIYDMCKAVDRAMVIKDIQLEEKSGGKSGHYIRQGGA